jgi:hypothetical protein
MGFKLRDGCHFVQAIDHEGQKRDVPPTIIDKRGRRQYELTQEDAFILRLLLMDVDGAFLREIISSKFLVPITEADTKIKNLDDRLGDLLEFRVGNATIPRPPAQITPRDFHGLQLDFSIASNPAVSAIKWP